MENNAKASLSIAVIMDGNRRWARLKNLSDHDGHTEGYKRFLELLGWSLDAGISYVTVFAFSSENWKRSKKEIDHLQGLIQGFGLKEKKSLVEKGVRVKFLGVHDKFSSGTVKAISDIERSTEECNSISLNIALSYGGRQEIVLAADAWSKSGGDLTEEGFERFLQTFPAPDPDVVIRTGGERRLSNFLLWQIAYSELFFTDTLWPDFSEREFKKILKEFKKRDRRKGS